MASFDYKGLNSSGKNVRGHVEAENSKLARAKLKRDGIFVTEIKAKGTRGATKSKTSISIGSAVNVEEMALATRQLAVLVKSQIPLVDCLTALVDQVENPTLKSAIADIKQMVNEGSSFHKALAKYPKIFSKIYITMCEAGEMSGTLDIILLRLAEFTEKQNTLRNKVRSAMMYPIIMLCFSMLVMIALFVFVIPRITKVFDELGTTLPWYTELLINFSNFLVEWYMALTVAAIFFTFMFVRWKTSETGRPKWDYIKMRIPLFGKLIRMVAVSRFSKTLSTLLAGGVPMLNAFDIVKNVVDNKVFEKVIVECRDNVSEGDSVAGPLKRSGEFPPIVIHMVAIGERTGELENMLTQISDTYDFQVDNTISGLTSMLEPVMLIFMGCIIGFIVVAILVPIFEMTSSIN